ncbi:aspartic protease 3 [Plakobranchus ocellatus]|uniref:Aspartic protease 3 n=1 Tax=Plakobranchus ocellatus TaxID=259542 RepID=A0AAV4C0K4_9GAST|nr:aspartic protease 3 [Plakobranchus ocellatus]
MNLSLAAALALALISICAAHLIKPPWKSNIHRLSRFVRPKQSRGSHQPARASQPFPDGSPGHIAGRVKLTNYKNKLYHLPIEIGTPGQKFNMALYTSYSAMWVPSAHYPFSRIVEMLHNRSTKTVIEAAQQLHL